jgi:uncharacterized protein
MKATGPLQKAWLGCECAALYGGVPAAYALGWLRTPVLLLLAVMTLGCLVIFLLMGRDPDKQTPVFSKSREAGRIAGLNVVAWAVLAVALGATHPDLFLVLPRQRPELWAIIMVAYPLVSVLPQEFAYRVFFFRRYRPLFGEGLAMVAASTLAFGFAHVVFRNVLSVALTLGGGWLFGVTYKRTRSLAWVWAEHALYGWAIFTLGYGRWFFAGTMRLFQH